MLAFTFSVLQLSVIFLPFPPPALVLTHGRLEQHNLARGGTQPFFPTTLANLSINVENLSNHLDLKSQISFKILEKHFPEFWINLFANT